MINMNLALRTKKYNLKKNLFYTFFSLKAVYKFFLNTWKFYLYAQCVWIGIYSFKTHMLFITTNELFKKYTLKTGLFMQIKVFFMFYY